MIKYWSSHIRIKKTKSSFHNKCVNVKYGDKDKKLFDFSNYLKDIKYYDYK